MYVCSAHNRCRVVDSEDALEDLLDLLTESNDDLTTSSDHLTTSSDHMTAKRLPTVFHIIIAFVIIQVHEYF